MPSLLATAKRAARRSLPLFLQRPQLIFHPRIVTPLVRHVTHEGMEQTHTERLLEAANPLAVRAGVMLLSRTRQLAPQRDRVLMLLGRTKDPVVANLLLTSAVAAGDFPVARGVLRIAGTSPADASRMLERLVTKGDPSLVADVAALMGDLDTTDMSPLGRAAYTVGRALAGGQAAADVMRDHPDDPHVAEVLALVSVSPSTPLAELREVADQVTRSEEPSSRVIQKLALELSRRGEVLPTVRLLDLPGQSPRVGSRLDGVNTTMRAIATTIEQGWTPPAPSPRTVAPHPLRAMYLLHNSLPHASGGYATRTHGLLTGLVGSGWDMHGVTSPTFPKGALRATAAPLDVIDGVSYHRLRPTEGFRLWPAQDMADAYARLLDPAVTSLRPGIIHGASNFRNGLAAVTAARRHGLPSVYEVRGLWELTRQVRQKDYADTDSYAVTERLEAAAAINADRVLVITRALGRMMVDRGVPEHKITLVPNGVDAERFTPLPRDEALAAELGFTGKTVIGYIGTTVDYEGLGLLLEAVAELRHERDDFRVLIVGDGAQWQQWYDQATDMQLLDLVTFTGRIPHGDVERYYSLVDIAPLPRLPEQVCEVVSPLKPFEVMAVGKTLVVSSVDALAEIVQDGVTGLVFEKGSAPALTRTLRTVLDNPDLRARINSQAREWVVRERSWKHLSDIVAEVYRDVWSEYHPDVPLEVR